MLRLSNSEMKEYRRCLRKWYLNYYRGLGQRDEETPGGNLSIGNAVHDALAAYYDPAAPLRDPVAFAEAAAAARTLRQPENEISIRKELDLVRLMLEGYVEWLGETGADQGLEITGTEQMVEVPLVEGVTLLSKLDAPVTRTSDSAHLALEHKTTQSLDAALPTLKLDTQLLTEHLARFLHDLEQGMTPEESINACQGILYNQLRKVKRTASAKPPFYDRIDVPHNLHELRAHWHHVVAIARAIEQTRARLDAGQSHHAVCPPNPTRDCSWDCPFFKVCPMADDGSDFEGALGNLYVKRDPLARYNGALPLAEGDAA